MLDRSERLAQAALVASLVSSNAAEVAVLMLKGLLPEGVVEDRVLPARQFRARVEHSGELSGEDGRRRGCTADVPETVAPRRHYGSGSAVGVVSVGGLGAGVKGMRGSRAGVKRRGGGHVMAIIGN